MPCCCCALPCAQVGPLVRSYLGNTLHLLSNVTEAAMLAFVLRRLRASAAMLAPFAKIQRRLLKLALQLFSSAQNAPRLQVGPPVRGVSPRQPSRACCRCW